jgi:hypothetical protein
MVAIAEKVRGRRLPVLFILVIVMLRFIRRREI